MKPPYEINTTILNLLKDISEKIGQINAHFLTKPSPQLRKQNRIKTIHHSLKIEGNTLSLDQVAAIIENKKVLGPKKDITEVENAIKIYESLPTLNSNSEKSFLKAHQVLLKNLVPEAGKYRVKNVGIANNKGIEHIAPSSKMVPQLMKNLFAYLKIKNELTLIKSCVFHYELEFIHPFLDGNGRMGRLWQTVILMQEYPILEFLPIEHLISKNQKGYYSALSLSDKTGQATPFLEFMLNIISKTLDDLLDTKSHRLNELERLEHFKTLNNSSFSRLDYMQTFKDISTATASRDLKKGVELKILLKKGDKNKATYTFKKSK